jgi:hypothetical protein
MQDSGNSTGQPPDLGRRITGMVMMRTPGRSIVAASNAPTTHPGPGAGNTAAGSATAVVWFEFLRTSKEGAGHREH